MNLASLLRAQLELQKAAYGEDPALLKGDDRANFIRSLVLASTDELHEALNETGWKLWSEKRHFNRSEYLDELIDALHFMLCLFLMAKDPDVSCEAFESEISARYRAKQAVNRQRQEEGY